MPGTQKQIAGWLAILVAILLPEGAAAQLTDCITEPTVLSTAEQFPPAQGVQPFTDIFDLYMEPAVRADAKWDEDEEVRAFMNGVIDAAQGGSFLPLWNYFCMGDEDPAWNAVAFRYKANQPQPSRRIRIVLQATDSGSSQDSTLIVGAKSPNNGNNDILAPASVAAGYIFAHELGHLMEAANLHQVVGSWEAEWFATAVEVVAGHTPWNSGYRTFQDVSFAALLGGQWPYQRFRFLSSYLHGNYAGDPGSATDDLFHQLVRSTGGAGAVPVSRYTRWSAVAAYLDGRPDVPGVDGDDRLGTVFHRAAMALFVDRPDLGDGRYGFGGLVRPDTTGTFQNDPPGSLVLFTVTAHLRAAAADPEGAGVLLLRALGPDGEPAAFTADTATDPQFTVWLRGEAP